MSGANNGHWKPEILPVARFGSSTNKQMKPGIVIVCLFYLSAIDIIIIIIPVRFKSEIFFI